MFSARRYRCSTSSTQRKQAKRAAQLVCACPLSGFDLVDLSRFKEEIKEMASLVFIQGVVFLTQFIILLLEKTGEET